MVRLTSEIVIGGWRINAVNEVSIIQDVATLTDTCEITLPKKVLFQINKEKEVTYRDKPIKRGDAVSVKLGYNGNNELRFTGFVRSVDLKIPVKIKCEDGMFVLKTKKVQPKTFANAQLKDVISYLLEGTGIKFKMIEDDLKLGNWRITKPTVAEELQELKEKMMLSCYFRSSPNPSEGGEPEPVLYVGLAYPTDNRKKIIVKYGKNLIAENFEYREKEDIRARVEAQSFDAKHKKITYEFGDKDGDVIKIRIDGLSEAELKKYAMQALERYKQSGFKGSFETFGQPEINKCDMVDITASDGNQGVYLIKKNEISFGLSGYRQKVELGQPLSIK